MEGARTKKLENGLKKMKKCSNALASKNSQKFSAFPPTSLNFDAVTAAAPSDEGFPLIVEGAEEIKLPDIPYELCQVSLNQGSASLCANSHGLNISCNDSVDNPDSRPAFPIHSVCRLCLKPTGINAVGIFSCTLEADGSLLCDMIMSVASVFIKKGDGLSEFVCLDCSSFLQTCAKFRVHVQQCEADMLEFLEKAQEEKSKQLKKAHSARSDHSVGKDNIQTEGGSATSSETTLPKPKRKKPLQLCDICGELKAYLHMGRHIEMCRHPSRNLCIHCGITCGSPKQLNHHITYHHTHIFVCDICNRSFKQKPLLENHIRTHTKDTPFKCTFCKQKFNKKWNLDQHVRIHTGVMPFKCDLCDLPFRYKVSMKQHRAKCDFDSVGASSYEQPDLSPEAPL